MKLEQLRAFAPFPYRALFGCHTQLGPCTTAAFFATPCVVQRGGVPFWTRAAGGFAGSEGFGWGGGEAGASEAVRGVAESGEHFAGGW